MPVFGRPLSTAAGRDAIGPWSVLEPDADRPGDWTRPRVGAMRVPGVIYASAETAGAVVGRLRPVVVLKG